MLEMFKTMGDIPRDVVITRLYSSKADDGIFRLKMNKDRLQALQYYRDLRGAEDTSRAIKEGSLVNKRLKVPVPQTPHGVYKSPLSFDIVDGDFVSSDSDSHRRVRNPRIHQGPRTIYASYVQETLDQFQTP